MFDPDRPLTLAQRTEFCAFQKTDGYYACCRPGNREPDLPLTLLDPVFATFLEESQKAVLTREDYEAARSVRDAMCNFYRNRRHRASALRQELLDYGIEIIAGDIGDSDFSTDGHKQCNRRPTLITAVRNELGSGGGDPSIQTIAHFELFRTEYLLWTELQSYHPSFIMFVAGMSLALVSLVVNVTHQVQDRSWVSVGAL